MCGWYTSLGCGKTKAQKKKTQARSGTGRRGKATRGENARAHLEAAAVKSGRRLVCWHEEVVVRCVIESRQGCGLRRRRDIGHGCRRPPADPRNEGGRSGTRRHPDRWQLDRLECWWRCWRGGRATSVAVTVGWEVVAREAARARGRRDGHEEGEALSVDVLATVAALPLLRLLVLVPLGAVDVVGVHSFVLLLLLLCEVIPVLLLLRGKALPLLGDRLREVRLALLLDRPGRSVLLLLRCLALLALLPSEENESILWPLDVVVVALLRPPLPDVACGRSTPAMRRGLRGWRGGGRRKNRNRGVGSNRG